MFLSLVLALPLVCAAAAKLKPGVYHVCNLDHPYAPAAFNNRNRVFVPQAFSGSYDLWQVSAHADGITIQNLRGNHTYAQVSSPAQGQFVSIGTRPSPFNATLSGTADFPGDDGIIPDTHLEYWTIASPTGLAWTIDTSVGPEVYLRPLHANRTATQYWMFAPEGSLPFLPRDLDENEPPISSPSLVFLS